MAEPHVPYASGPEALDWLTESSRDAALASNRFSTTRKAIRFVERLYALGSPYVRVPEDSIDATPETIDTEGGAYADALVVSLPTDRLARRRVLAVCRKEAERDGEEFDADEACERGEVFLWWD